MGLRLTFNNAVKDSGISKIQNIKRQFLKKGSRSVTQNRDLTIIIVRAAAVVISFWKTFPVISLLPCKKVSSITHNS